MFKFSKKSPQEAAKKVEAQEQAKAARHNQGDGVADAAQRRAADRRMPTIHGSVAADMSAFSRDLAAKAAGQGLSLDFTPASLAGIDRMLVSLRRMLSTVSETERRGAETNAGLQVGAYLGEVVRRHEGGQWTGDYGLPAVDLGEFIAPVVEVALRLLADGRVPMPDAPVETLAAYYQSVSDSQMQWLDRVVRGEHPTVDDLMTAMTDDAELARWLILQSRLCVKTARSKWNLRVDYSPDSLTGVEEVLGQLHTLLAGAAPEERPTDGQIEGAARYWGVYVGEVLRRAYGGKWKLTDAVLGLEVNTVRIFPLRKVQKRIVDGPGDAIPFYFHATGKAIRGELK